MNGSDTRSHSLLRVPSFQEMISSGRAGPGEGWVATEPKATDDEDTTAVGETNGVAGTSLDEATATPRRRRQGLTPQSSYPHVW